MVVESENTCQGILASATGKKAAAEVGSVARSAVSSLGRMYSELLLSELPPASVFLSFVTGKHGENRALRCLDREKG